MVCFIKRLPLTRELSAQLTEGEKNLDILQSGSFLSLRQNLRFCHLPRQREALIFYDTVMPPPGGASPSPAEGRRA